MGVNSDGGQSPAQAEQLLNVFALVIYVPDPLGRFLDELRRELVPDYRPHAHVSVLPPRPLAVDWRTASDQVRLLAESWAPFEVELTGLEVFPVTDVLFLAIGGGDGELRRMHAALNSAALEFEEPFSYHPHVTLAQDVPRETVPALHEQAQRRWKEYAGNRTFRAERAVFVQNTLDDRWIDLAEYELGAVAVR
jgi:2'-5' RNA ligase